jgi:hypothetical protein
MFPHEKNREIYEYKICIIYSSNTAVYMKPT